MTLYEEISGWSMKKFSEIVSFLARYSVLGLAIAFVGLIVTSRDLITLARFSEVARVLP